MRKRQRPTSAPTPTTEPGWNNNQYHYEGAQAHAVTSVDRPLATDTFEYDANGNMIERVEAGTTWTQGFNAENRLSSISDGTDTWTFIYDGDGNRVKQVGPNGEVTLYLGGGLFEVRDAASDANVVKYYSIAGQRVAMQNSEGVQYLLTDHLGSVSAVLDDTGALLSQQRYLPFGAERQIGGGVYETDFGYTGQRDLEAVGLMDYNARFYDMQLAHFSQGDSIILNFKEPQMLNRYGYVGNNPLNFLDPSGYSRDKSPACDGQRDKGCGQSLTGVVLLSPQTIDDFNALTWSQRKQWLKSFAVANKLEDWLGDISTQLNLLSNDVLVRNNQYVMLVDAVVLQAIQNGMYLYRNSSIVCSPQYCDAARQAAQAWASFYMAVFSGDQENQIPLRLSAEQAGVDFGTAYATEAGTYQPDAPEQDYIDLFVGYADWYRSCFEPFNICPDPRTSDQYTPHLYTLVLISYGLLSTPPGQVP